MRTKKNIVILLPICLLVVPLASADPSNYGDWDKNCQVTLYAGKIDVQKNLVDSTLSGTYYGWVFWESSVAYSNPRIWIIIDDFNESVSEYIPVCRDCDPMAMYFNNPNIRLKYNIADWSYTVPVIVTFSRGVITKISVDMPKWTTYARYWESRGFTLLASY